MPALRYIALGLLLATLATPALALEDLAAVLPAETVLYARCAGFKTLLSELEGSRMLKDGPFVAQLYREQVGKIFPQLQEATEIPVKVWQEHLDDIRGAHFALFGFGASLDDLDALGVVEIKDAEKVRELIRKTIGEQSVFAGEVAGAKVQSIEAGPATVYYAIHESKLFVTNRPERMSAVLGNLAEIPDKSLATLPAYRAGALRAGKETTLFAYADMPRLFTMLENTMGRSELRFFAEMDSVLKLDGLKTACIASGHTHCRGRAVVDVNQPWLDIFRGEVGPSTLTPFLPPDTFFALVDSGDIAKKWVKLKRYLTSDQFPFAKDMKKGLAEAQKMLGVSLDEIAATMGNEWAWIVPVIGGRLNDMDESMTFAFRIKDREKFDALLGKFMKSPLIKEIQEEMAIGVTKYAGYDVIKASREGHDQAPCLAIVDDTLILSGDFRALKAAIDANTKGEGMLSRSAVFLDGLSGSSSKFASLSLYMMMMMEREWTPLIDIVREGAVIAATADEAPGRIDLLGNESIPAFVGLMFSGELLQDRYRKTKNDCVANMNAVGQALKKFREKNNGQNPSSLLALVPEYLSKEKLICPLDHGREGHKCSYDNALGTGEADNSWFIDAWCPHRLHGRVVLRRGGNAYSTSESSLLRSLGRQGVKLPK